MAPRNRKADPEPRALAASSTPRTTGHARSITAAAKRIDLSSAKDRAAIPRSTEQWKRDGWGFYDLVPEVKFAGRFLGSALSRILLFPGIRVAADEPLAQLRDVLDLQAALRASNADLDPGERISDRDLEAAMPAPGLTEEMVLAAEEEMTRLQNRRTGQSGLLRSWGVCLTISGDSWLVGTDERDAAGELTGEEEWQVLSDLNVEKKGNSAAIRLAPGATQEQLPEDATLIRVWRPHEAWPALSDSNMRAALDTCDELLIYARQFRSVGKSRNNAGVLLVPSELDFVNQAAIDPESGLPLTDDNGLTPLESGMVTSMISPVEDDGTAAAVVPHFLRGPAEYLEKVRHIALDRKIDEQAIPRLNFLLTRLAHGLDVPVEVLLGLGEVNHWTAWQIEDSTYKAHVEPLASLPAWALTSAYLRPMLREHQAWQSDDARAILARVEVGLDPSLLVQRPNRAQDAKDAHKAMAISDAALRKYLGLSDADAPDDDELLRRYALMRGIGEGGLTREVMRGTIPPAEEIILAPDEAVAAQTEAEQAALPDDAPAEQDQPTPATEPVAASDALVAGLGRGIAARITRPIDRMAMVAAATGNTGARLAAIDQRLRARLQEAASAALEDALRTAGNRLRAKAANDPALRASVVGIDPHQVGPVLAAAGALTQDEEDDALAGAFGPLAVKWDEMVSQAQDDTEATLRAASAVDGEPLEREMAEYRATTEEDRHAGWAVLVALLAGLARARIRGMEDDPSEGEFDTTVSVQAGPVREALARAGGSVEPTRPPAQVAGTLQPGAAGGVATGPRSLGTLIRLGLATTGWEWVTGAPSHPFPAHQRLAGTRFTSWDDPALSHTGWPAAHLYPGDHRGCQCDAVPIIVEVSARATSAA